MKNCVGIACLATILVSGCDSSPKPSATGRAGDMPVKSNLVGAIKIDGSSTVQPISNAVREGFLKLHPKVEISVSGNGTGNGFKSFYDQGTDISDASRPITPKEFKKCQENGVNFIELPVAYDGLTIAVHPKNDWVKELTIDQLKKMFVGDDAAKKWSDVDPSWPKETIKIFAPGTGSGTYDYFHEVLAKPDDKDLRGDMTLNESDTVLVQGVSTNKYSIGFFGVAYYAENRDKLRAVPVVNPADQQAYEPTVDNISSNKYAPLSRPLFIYVNADSLNRAEVQVFVQYYLENVSEICPAANSVRLPDSTIQHSQKNLDAENRGTHFVNPAGESREGSFDELFVDENLVK